MMPGPVRTGGIVKAVRGVEGGVAAVTIGSMERDRTTRQRRTPVLGIETPGKPDITTLTDRWRGADESGPTPRACSFRRCRDRRKAGTRSA